MAVCHVDVNHLNVDEKYDVSELPEVVQTWPVDDLSSSIPDYDGSPLYLEGERTSLSISSSGEIDDTTCLFPFEVKLTSPTAMHPTGFRRVPCGHCEDCKRRLRNQWMFRIKQEAKSHLLNYFITLTYDDDHILFDNLGNPSVHRPHIQSFFKVLRKLIYPSKIRYFGIAEYGPRTFRPHYHVIIFGWPSSFDLYSTIKRSWSHGQNITLTALIDAQIMYVCRYHTDKGFTPKNYEPTFTFMSRNPGIGFSYTQDPAVRSYYHADPNRAVSATLEGGKKTSLGRYLRTKLYGKDFECPSPEYTKQPLKPKSDRYIEYYQKKQSRKARRKGKI